MNVQHTTSSGRLRRALFLLTTVLLNVLFFIVVDSAATVDHHVTVVLDGSTARARLDGSPEVVWEGALSGPGTSAYLKVKRALGGGDWFGIDEVREYALGAERPTRVERFFPWQPPAWQIPPDWSVDHRGHLVTQRESWLHLGGTICADCRLEIDLVDAGAFTLLLRARDEQSGLVAQWDSGELSWRRLEAGTAGPIVARVRVSETDAERWDRWNAVLSQLLLGGYGNGWRFVWWYLRSSWPWILGVIGLGAMWTLGERLVPRVFKGGGPPGRRWRAGLVAGAGAVAFVSTLVAAHWLGRMNWAIVVIASAAGMATGTLVAALCERVATQPEWVRQRARTAATATALGLSVAGASLGAYASLQYVGAIPHVQDSVSYLLGAKAIASGHLRIPVAPELAPFFQLGPFLGYENGFLCPLTAGLYFVGHPALLALGVLAGAPWIVNPVSSGITLFLLFLLCRELFGSVTGLMAAALGALSPFVCFQSASMMTHSTVLLFTTAALLLVVYWVQHRAACYAVGSGLAVGMALNVRPFDAGILGFFVALVIVSTVRTVGLRRVFTALLWLALGVLPFALLLIWQFETLGGGVRPEARALLTWTFEAAQASYERLNELNSDLLGWTHLRELPGTMTIGVLLVALLIMPKTAADLFAAGWALLFVVAYAPYGWHGNMFGPRYWFASVGGQLILVARCLQVLPDMLARACCRAWPLRSVPYRLALARVAAGLPMLILVAPWCVRVLTEAYPGPYRSWYGPDYNGFSRAPLDLVEANGVKRGLVFVADVPRWQDVFTAIAANDFSLAGNLVYARHIEGKDHLLVEARPTHPPYVITWNGNALELSHMEIDPITKQETASPLAAASDVRRLLGGDDVFSGLSPPDGAALIGGLRIGPGGEFYVMYGGHRRVLVFGPDGKFRRALIASYGFGPAAIRGGHGLAVDAAGGVFVADAVSPGVVHLRADGTFGWRASGSGANGQPLREPLDVDLLPDGSLAVADGQSRRLHRLLRDGTAAGFVEASTEFVRPVALTVAANGHVYVVDAGANVLVELDGQYREVNRWTLALSPLAHEAVPYVAADAAGHAFVSSYYGWVVLGAVPGEATARPIGEAVPCPSGIAATHDSVYVIAACNRQIRKVPEVR